MIELTTQCPQCRHRFDVSLEQLQQRKGLLRCAQCAHIFDSYECAVTTSTSTAPIPTPAPSLLRVPHLRTHFIGDTPLASGIKPPQPIRSSQPIQPELNAYSDIRVYLEATASEPEFVAAPEPVLVSAPVSSIPRPKPYYAGQKNEAKTGFLWRLLLGLLLLFIVAQLLYVYRAQIANSVPLTRPVLQWLCEGIDCNLPYMREIDAIEVRQSALQEIPALSSGNTYAYQLQLQLKNNLAWPQEWPTLVLSFSDAAAAGMATIAIEPAEYLPVEKEALPFEAGAQQSIRVPVRVQGKKINGFSVEKYYP